MKVFFTIWVIILSSIVAGKCAYNFYYPARPLVTKKAMRALRFNHQLKAGDINPEGNWTGKWIGRDIPQGECVKETDIADHPIIGKISADFALFQLNLSVAEANGFKTIGEPDSLMFCAGNSCFPPAIHIYTSNLDSTKLAGPWLVLQICRTEVPGFAEIATAQKRTLLFIK